LVGSVDGNPGKMGDVVRQKVDEEEGCSEESGDPGQQANYVVGLVAGREPALASVRHREDQSHEDPEPDLLCTFGRF